MVLFSTGRGTPLGGPVPTIKIATNQVLADKKRTWIDFNAAPMLQGKNLSKELLQYVTEVANGLETANEREGYREIAIFKDGVTL